MGKGLFCFRLILQRSRGIEASQDLDFITNLLHYGVAMLCMAAVSLFYSPPAFVVELVIAIAALAAVLVGEKKFKAHVGSAVRAAKNVLTAQDYEALNSFSIPVAAVAEEGDLVWANVSFCGNQRQEGYPGRKCFASDLFPKRCIRWPWIKGRL